MNQNVKTPWYTSYDNVREHLEYPDCSMYQFIKERNKEALNNYAYNYFGKKGTFEKLLEMIDECAKALKALGVMEQESVSIGIPNIPKDMVVFFAIKKMGAVATHIHPFHM